MNRVFLFLLAIAAFLSCSQDHSSDIKKEAITDSVYADSTTELTFEEPAVYPDALVIDTSLFSLPFKIDNDNYRDFFEAKRRYQLSSNEFNSLDLGSLEDCKIEDGCEFYILGELDLSTEFCTRVVFRTVISEWKMWLVNYDSENHRIDHLLILCGDNVEYMSETFALVEKNKITVTDINYDYSGGEELTEKIEMTYKINDDGKFIGQD